jgi:flagellar biosynthesis protein FlhG
MTTGSQSTGRALRVFAITSGKGGVGKTNLTVNLAVAFSQAGRKVLVVDGDVGLANVDILLDESPEKTLRDVLKGGATLSEILHTSTHGPTLLPGSSGAVDLATLTETDRLSLVSGLDQIGDRFDTVLVDTAAGIASNALFFASAAEDALVIVTPEPTSLADGYGAIKALSTHCGMDRVGLVVNMAESEREAREVFGALSGIVTRFLPVVLDMVGWVPHDVHVRESIMTRTPVIVAYPEAPASRAIRELSDRIIMRPASESSGRLQFFWRRLTGMAESEPSAEAS